MGYRQHGGRDNAILNIVFVSGERGKQGREVRVEMKGG